ncbi:MAG: SprT-like domain-containing protein [Bacteroidota bacterium]
MTSAQVFTRFVPPEAVQYCDQLYQQLNFEFKVKKSRQTKLGDYRYNFRTGQKTITVNNDLNPYAFLITYLHEVAHLMAFKQYGRNIKPHGGEWKQCFREIAFPILNPRVLPEPVDQALKNYLANPKASSCADPKLYRVLRQFDQKQGAFLLSSVSEGELFCFQGVQYRKLKKKRTRSICVRIDTKKKYLIAELAEVSKSNPEPLSP